MGTQIQRTFTLAADAAGAVGEGIPYDFDSIVAFQIENIGANPLDSLIVQFQNHPEGDWFDYATDEELVDPDAGYYYLHPDAVVLHNLPAGVTVQYSIKVLAAYALRFKAICAAGTTLEFKGIVQS